MSPRTKRLLWMVPLGLVLAAIAAFLVWAWTPLGPTDVALAALQSGDGVTTAEKDWGWRFAPDSEEPTTGIVLYPGGRVDFRSYAPLAREIAARGHVVALVKVPLSLAITDTNAAADPIASEPGVSVWAVGGHSLGGVAASMYAGSDERIAGLALLASYPSGTDLSGRPIAVADITASNDLVLDQAGWDAARSLLPPASAVYVIEGGNHAQFGSYGPQPGDGEATIPAEDQWTQTADMVDRMLDELAVK